VGQGEALQAGGGGSADVGVGGGQTERVAPKRLTQNAEAVVIRIDHALSQQVIRDEQAIGSFQAAGADPRQHVACLAMVAMRRLHPKPHDCGGLGGADSDILI
jgi:hypothetical protein